MVLLSQTQSIGWVRNVFFGQLVCGLLLFSGFFLNAFAADRAPDLVIENQDRYELSRLFTYFDDASGQLTLQDILQADEQNKFNPLPKGVGATNFGATHSAIWLRLKLRVNEVAPARWLVDVAYPPLDRVDLYVANGPGAFAHQSGGDSLAFRLREIVHHNHVKAVDFVPGQDSVLYLRVASQGTLAVPVVLWQPAALWKNDQITYSAFSLYFGLLIGLIAYNLLLFVSVRDRIFLIYVVFAICIGLSQAANSGLGAQFLWPDQLFWNMNSINILHSASGAMGMLFARNFLATRVTLPRLDVAMRAQELLWWVVAGLALIIPYRTSVWLVTGMVSAGVVTIVVAGTISIYRKRAGARFFGLAWSALLAGVVVMTLHNNGLVPSNSVTANALLIGSALEMVLLSFALADRINVTRREKELAQAQVTSEQAMVLALHQSQERYRSVIEHVAEGMVVVQLERVVFVNRRAAEILEAGKESILQDGFYARLHGDDQALLAQRQVDRRNGLPVAQRCQVRAMLADGAVKWLELGDTLVPWDGGPGLLVFFLDVTEHHVAEQEIRAALERQRELNDLRSRFVSMTSHEFRTPLATILSSQDILKNYNDRLPEDQKNELFDMIENGVKRMTRMVERVLLVARVDAHMLEFKPKLMDPRQLCDELIAEARLQQPDTRCVLSATFAPDLQTGLFDDQLLRHILGNLLSNAVKYSPDGGSIRLEVGRDGGQTVFEVSDQGIGIPPDELDHLFESFHRASNVGTIQGTGLGLAIVKQSVEAHGGRISVTSQIALGTRFAVRL